MRQELDPRRCAEAVVLKGQGLTYVKVAETMNRDRGAGWTITNGTKGRPGRRCRTAEIAVKRGQVYLDQMTGEVRAAVTIAILGRCAEDNPPGMAAAVEGCPRGTFPIVFGPERSLAIAIGIPSAAALGTPKVTLTNPTPVRK